MHYREVSPFEQELVFEVGEKMYRASLSNVKQTESFTINSLATLLNLTGVMQNSFSIQIFHFELRKEKKSRTD